MREDAWDFFYTVGVIAGSLSLFFPAMDAFLAARKREREEHQMLKVEREAWEKLIPGTEISPGSQESRPTKDDLVKVK